MLKYSIEELINRQEGQQFDRKSGRIDVKDLVNSIIGFANADGGVIVIGIYDGKIEGMNNYKSKTNDFLQASIDFCNPTVKVNPVFLDCKNHAGQDDSVLILEIEQGTKVHSNQKDEVFLRVGDETRKLNFDDRLQLMYDKGEIYFESTVVREAALEDIDLELLKKYKEIIGYERPSEELLISGLKMADRKDDKIEIKASAVLLFGKEPTDYFPRAHIRFLRYEGTEEKTGTQMNIIKDKIIKGPLPILLNKTFEFVEDQLREFTRLGKDGKFETIKEYPEFVWKEAIVNAVVHRDYSIKGTDIQIKMFDDRLVVESPGKLPGLVRLHNMREIHFSRNPKIAATLKDFKFVKELGEGVDRMFREMHEHGLPAPEYSEKGFMTVLTVKNGREEDLNISNEIPDNETKVIEYLKANQRINRKETEKLLGKGRGAASRVLKSLKEKGIIKAMMKENHPDNYYVLSIKK